MEIKDFYLIRNIQILRKSTVANISQDLLVKLYDQDPVINQSLKNLSYSIYSIADFFFNYFFFGVHKLRKKQDSSIADMPSCY